MSTDPNPLARPGLYGHPPIIPGQPGQWAGATHDRREEHRWRSRGSGGGALARLIAHGLRIESQLAVPGALADPGDAPADVLIRRNPPCVLAEAPVYRRTATGLIFTCPGVARYAIAPDEIAVTPDRAAAEDAVSDMLIATALPALLWLRGLYVLHAAAAILPGADAAIAIAGMSGSGKSTILAQLAAAGAVQVADDTIAVDPATAWGAGLAGGWFAVQPDGPRRFMPAEHSATGARIAALFILTDRGDTEEFVPVTGVARVAALLAQRHRPRVPAVLGQAGAAVRNVTLLARAFPIYSWRRRAGAPGITPAEWAMLQRGAQRD